MSKSTASRPLVLVLIAALVPAMLVPLGVVRADHAGAGHLLISEVVTGGASASDEFVELYNPGPLALPLEGLELVYVSASGATITRRAAWDLGAPSVPAGHHVMVANELGAYASIADALYGSGLAATGGSVALRIQGATTAIDAVGWGTAVSTWLEATPASVAPAGSSIERLPGGAAGSTQDTDNNLADFVVRSVPDPQNSTSQATPDPDQPSPTPTPAWSSSSGPSPTTSLAPSPAPSASPGFEVVSVATARALPNGTQVTIEGTALTGSSFNDGGGYVADSTGGVAVLVTDGAFGRGALLRVTGTLDDRFSQRTIRVTGADVAVIGEGSDPSPTARATGTVDESVEGGLARIYGVITGSPTELTAGLAFDVDDGSGSTRVIVVSLSEIDTSRWLREARVDLVGVVGQRDATGSGSVGYRVQPRDASDVISVGPPNSSPSASGSVAPTASPDASEDPAGITSIADARMAPKNARVRVRGVVTLPPGIVDPVSAVIQDGTGAIMLRVGDEVGSLPRGSLIEVDGVRSTKSGMETLRVTTPARALGTAVEPDVRTVRTGEVAEGDEAQLVSARGALVTSARRASSGTVSFEIDDGSGPLRVSFGASLAVEHELLTAGAWIEVRGVLGQETTGALPTRGYRVWPRDASDLRMLAEATDPAPASAAPDQGSTASGSGQGLGSGPTEALGAVGRDDLTGLRIGATLVVAAWPELGIAGVLWDGERLVAIAEETTGRLSAVIGARRPPLALELGGLRAVGSLAGTSIPVVALGAGPDDLTIHGLPPAPPATSLSAASASAKWVSIVGRLSGNGSSEREIILPGRRVTIERRCDDEHAWPDGSVAITGVALGEPVRLMVPCGGVAAAPILSRAMSAPVTARTPATRDPRFEPLTHSSDPGRLLAAGLLGLGSLVIAVGAVVYRRFHGEGIDPEPAAGTPVSHEPPDGDARRPPTVSLVRMPHERGSP